MNRISRIDRLSRSKKGQMPFALIAVTLLILGSTFCIVVANIKENQENADSMTKEIMSVSDAINDTKKYIEAGAGTIINDISTSESGTLVERTSKFEDRMKKWMSSAFPLRCDGVEAVLDDYCINLELENLKLSSGSYVDDRIVPSFFRAAGTATVEYVTSTGTSVKTFNISADGTSGLPFILENVTKFELSSSGGASVLTELMTYQLSSLAQSRIINGYGAISENGDKGTRSILTENDVEKSFRSSLSIIESLCFRTTGDAKNELNCHDRVDAAELFVCKDGYLDIDLSAAMSQTMVALSDQLIAKWLDLFFAKEILNGIDAIEDYTEFGVNWLIAQITGVDNNSARPYIESLMSSKGYNDGDYRRICGDTVTLEIEGGTFERNMWYLFEETQTIEPFTVTVKCPDIDVIGWSGWNEFMSNYAFERNDIIEHVKNIVNTAAVKAANDGKGIRIHADAFDDRSFIENLTSAVSSAFNDGISEIERITMDTINADIISDPKYAAICDEMKKSKNSIFNIDAAMEKIRSSVESEIEKHLNEKYGKSLDRSVTETLLNQAMNGNAVQHAKKNYENGAERMMQTYENVMADVPANNNSIVKTALSETFKMALNCNEIHNAMEKLTTDMISDMAQYQTANTESGIIDLDSSSSFILYDTDGNTHEEFISLKDSYDLDIGIVSPKDNSSKNSHVTDIDIFTLSPFTSVFTVSLKTEVKYDVSSTSAVLDAIGWFDAKTDGKFTIDTKFDIACVSGWALAGVKYQDTVHITDEIIEYLLKVCEPLLEPLKKLFAVLKEIFEICSTAIVEISAYVNEMVMKFYDAVMEPIMEIKEYIENGVLQAIGGFAFDVGIATQEFSVEIFGMKLTLETRLASLAKNTKTLCKLTLESSIGDIDFSASVEIRYSEKNGYMFKGTGEISGGDWKVKLMIDPSMKFGNKFLTATGKIRGVEFSAALPEIVQYDKIDMTVSDVPGVGTAVSNIPLPIPGLKGSFDMGFELKYNYHIPNGLLINEFESNPKGTDTDGEWVELYNATMGEIDVDGYVLVPGSDESKSMILSGTVKPYEKKVFRFEKQALNNSKNSKGAGESVTLLNSYGEIVDSTPWKTDTYNDSRTWQRTSDGGTKWDLLEGSPGKSNGTPFGGSLAKTFIVDNLKAAAEKAFYEMGNHLTSIEDVAKFLELIVKLFIENVIESIADVLVSAAVFISFELTDYAETQHTGLKIALEMNSELVEEGLKWLLSQIEFLSTYIDSPKYTDPMEIVCNDTYFRTTAYTGISAPKFLSENGMQIQVGLSAGVNISGMMSAFGKETGKWKAEFGIVIEDCPFSMVPKKMNDSKGSMCDMWLLKMSFAKA